MYNREQSLEVLYRRYDYDVLGCATSTSFPFPFGIEAVIGIYVGGGGDGDGGLGAASCQAGMVGFEGIVGVENPLGRLEFLLSSKAFNDLSSCCSSAIDWV